MRSCEKKKLIEVVRDYRTLSNSLAFQLTSHANIPSTSFSMSSGKKFICEISFHMNVVKTFVFPFTGAC